MIVIHRPSKGGRSMREAVCLVGKGALALALAILLAGLQSPLSGFAESRQVASAMEKTRVADNEAGEAGFAASEQSTDGGGVRLC